MVSRGRPRGKGANVTAAAEAMLSEVGEDAAVVLLCDADLGDSAARLGPLIEAVEGDECDLAIAAFARRVGGGLGIALSAADGPSSGSAASDWRRRCRASVRCAPPSCASCCPSRPASGSRREWTSTRRGPAIACARSSSTSSIGRRAARSAGSFIGPPASRHPARLRFAAMIVLIGVASGFLAGLLGIGGGGLMVPMLVSVGGLRQRQAHAVSLGAVVVLALAAAITYGASDEVRLGTAAALFVGRGRRRPAGCASALQGERQARPAGVRGSARLHRRLPPADVIEALGFVALGVVVGAVSSFLGIGGGVILVAVLVAISDFGQHEAQATALAFMVPTATIGVLSTRRHGLGDLRVSAVLGHQRRRRRGGRRDGGARASRPTRCETCSPCSSGSSG